MKQHSNKYIVVVSGTLPTLEDPGEPSWSAEISFTEDQIHDDDLIKTTKEMLAEYYDCSADSIYTEKEWLTHELEAGRYYGSLTRKESNEIRKALRRAAI